MPEKLAKRVTQIKASPTLLIDAKAKQLRAQGVDIINLSVGEPDFDTPEFIKEAAIKALRDGFTKYTALDGIPELKEAIIQKLKTDNQLSYVPDQVIASTGLKQSLYNLCGALLDEGDEAIIPAPYWVSYPDMVKLTGATPVFVKTSFDTQLKITADQLKNAITPKTRLLILNSPSNPTGMAYSEKELQALADVLIRYPDIIILSDDVYEYILWGMDRFVNILNICPELKDRTVVGNGVSKSYAMTGWRLGYAAGPKYLIDAMRKIQSQSTSNPNSITQKAAVTALRADRSFFKPMLKDFKLRHDIMHTALSQMNGVECLPADGAFYLFPNMQKVIDRMGLKDDLQLTELLLEKANVAVVPGTPFGMEGCIRISYAISKEDLERAGRQMNEVLKHP